MGSVASVLNLYKIVRFDQNRLNCIKTQFTRNVRNNFIYQIDLIKMNIKNNQALHLHLIANKDFVDILKDEFQENEVQEIINYCKEINRKYPEVMDQFYDWIMDMDSNTNVLSIGWDSENWGPGGSGFISFDLVFGLVKMRSSDYEDEHTEIFDKENFSPWAIESLMNDFVEIDSDIYSEQELLDIAEGMGLDVDTKLTIKGKEIMR